MIKNYLKIAWRNLIKNKVYSALNIAGLAAGMAVALLIGLWVFNEYSYDRFLPDNNQLYKVKMNITSQHDGVATIDAIALPLAEVLRKNYPEIKYVAECDWVHEHGLLVGNKKLYVKGIAIGSDFLKMFQYPLIRGNANTGLKDAYSIVLTQSTAKALFGDADPLNKLVRMDNEHDLKVTAIMRDLPKNSSLSFNFLIPFSYNEQTLTWMKSLRSNWTNNSFQLFVMLQPNVNYARFAPKIKNIVLDNTTEMRQAKPEIILQPLKDWHLFADFENGKAAGGLIDYICMFSVIGILVLLIACINFMNLSTAHSEKRAREIGVRRALGSQKSDLICQFLTESILITFIAFLFSMLLVQMVLPSFNNLTGDFIRIPYTKPAFWLVMISYVLITGLLAGSRPAFYLSSFNAVKVLKGDIQAGKAATLPRKILVVVQFSCSVALIVATLIIYQQIQYVKNRPTGYSTEKLVMTDIGTDLNKNYDALKNDLMQSGMVENFARASTSLTSIDSHTDLTGWPGKTTGEEDINVGTIYISGSYFKTIGMKILTGRDFSSSEEKDTTNIILNEAAIRRMGLKDPLNQEISWNNHKRKVKIIGIVKNAVMESPFTPVAPALFIHKNIGGGGVGIYRLAANVNKHDAINKIGEIFTKYNPTYPYSYRFADEEYNKKFNLEVLVGKLSGLFAGLAIFISCLGLFGLTAYVAEQRTKEIGIRKVLGASITQVWLLLSTDFIVLVFISCLIASPLAYYFLHKWLQKYDYRIGIGPSVFVLSGIVVVVITLLTVSLQALKAALANPVKSLRSE